MAALRSRFNYPGITQLCENNGGNMSTEIRLNRFQYRLFRNQILSGFFLSFRTEKVLFEGDVTTAKPSLINQERTI